MRYHIIREERGTKRIIMQTDYEDKEEFERVAKDADLGYKILFNGKDVTGKYQKKP